MNKANSKEMFRFPHDVHTKTMLKWLRKNLNKARYGMRVRGRKPDKLLMIADGLPLTHFSRDGSIPLRYATELAVYMDGVFEHKCGACDTLKLDIRFKDGKIDELKGKLRALSNTLENRDEVILEQKTELNVIYKISSDRGTMITELREEVIQREHDNVSKDKRIVVLREELAQRDSQIERLMGVICNPKDRIKDLKTTVTELVKQATHLSLDNSALRDNLKEVRVKFTKSINMSILSAKCTSGLKKHLDETIQRNVTLTRKNKEKVKHIDRLKREYHIVRSTLNYVEKLFSGGK